MIRFIVVLLLVTVNGNLIAQKKKKVESHLLAVNNEWFEGSILLNDNTTLEGLINLDQSGVLSIRDGTISKVFTANNVRSFEFFDESIQKLRSFFTFPYEDSNTNVVRPLFFELLKEYQFFAVLSKLDPVSVTGGVTPIYSPSISSTHKTKLLVSQTETVYIMDQSGEIKPYFKTINRDSSNKRFLSEKTSNKMIEDDLLISYITEATYKELELYAEENDLEFKIKEDFLRILDYYDTLK